ncbi:NAD(P)-dependent oxidoreductase [Alkalihalobacillus sp. TS-13]|uniref:NAD(P)-dependent oxidoreductase n=1 Tax=Alkalihalobacillus sp. TS-13 TaxID=2842455 RepID=UPI001C87EE99|nr:NAD(P)-dependent oxidoreductase [Alkalihalobacillus sp. TS-13]
MKIGIIGASGKSGKMILKEVLRRNHDVTAIVRNGTSITHPDVNVVEKNIYDLTPNDLKPYDVVVNAFGAPIGEEKPHVTAGHALIEALNGTNTRVIVIGGAGSLYVDEKQTTRLIDTEDLPENVQRTAIGQTKNLQELRESQGITWTYVSPPAFFDPEGPKTGVYQKGKDNLLKNTKGESYISYADLSIAVVDEIENPQHINERFTVVSESS